MNTYNFEQAIEGLAHGIPVKREGWRDKLIINGADKEVVWKLDLCGFRPRLDDFYATDLVDAS